MNLNQDEPEEGVCKFSFPVEMSAVNRLGKLFERFSLLLHLELWWTPSDGKVYEHYQEGEAHDSEDREIIMNVSSAYAEWKQQTLQEGRQEGRQEGQREGQREGELRGQREMLVQFMALKFGSLSAQVVSQVQSITDTQKLQQLADALTRSPDLESFLQNL
jgi:hypothetical protein